MVFFLRQLVSKQVTYRKFQIVDVVVRFFHFPLQVEHLLLERGHGRSLPPLRLGGGSLRGLDWCAGPDFDGRAGFLMPLCGWACLHLLLGSFHPQSSGCPFLKWFAFTGKHRLRIQSWRRPSDLHARKLRVLGGGQVECTDVELLLRGALEVSGGEPVVEVAILVNLHVVGRLTCAEGDAVIIVDLFKCCLNAVYIFGHDVDVRHIQMGEPQTNHMTSGRLQLQ